MFFFGAKSCDGICSIAWVTYGREIKGDLRILIAIKSFD